MIARAQENSHFHNHNKRLIFFSLSRSVLKEIEKLSAFFYRARFAPFKFWGWKEGDFEKKNKLQANLYPAKKFINTTSADKKFKHVQLDEKVKTLKAAETLVCCSRYQRISRSRNSIQREKVHGKFYIVVLIIILCFRKNWPKPIT